MRKLQLRTVASLILALMLTIVPLPDLLASIRPPWVLLLVLYVQFHLPEYFKVAALFLVGLVLDSLLATVIGEHAFAMSLVCWVASTKSRRFYCFSMGQQMALIGLFCGLYQFTIAVIDAFLGFPVLVLNVTGSTLISILLWPWVCLYGEAILLSKMRYRR